MSSSSREGRSTRWLPLTQLGSALVVGAGLLLAGALLGRADLAALGIAPLVLGVRGWARRPGGPFGVVLDAAAQLTADRELGARVLLDVPDGSGAVRVRASSPGTRHDEAVVRAVPGEPRSLGLTATSVRTGENTLFRVDAVGLDSGATIASSLVTVGPASVLVLPGWKPLAGLPLPWRLHGLVGPHTSRRIGDGTELHDVAPFRPGDRLRRIDWRTSARRGLQGGQLHELYVRRTQAPAEATVMLVIDSRDEVGPDVTTWAGGRQVSRSDATSLDIAREAAASIARGFLTGGDRVGLEDLGRRQRPVPPSGGRRHLERIVRRLALSAPERSPRPRLRAPAVPAGALIVVLSTFLDDEAMSLALTWRHSGHRVVAVDVLPPVRGAQLSTRVLMAYRMVAIQRADRLGMLRQGGVEVVRWADDGPAPAGDRTQPAGGQAQLAALARAGRHGAPR